MEFLPYISSAIIIVAFLLAFKYIRSVKDAQIKQHKNWMEQLPSLISTLGVIGTFVGITVGLIAFNPGDLDNSIPELLDGLKTAFFTSLLGMTGSIILNRVLSKKISNDDHEFDLKAASETIVAALNKNHNALQDRIPTNEIRAIRIDIELVKNNLINVRNDVEQMKDDIEELKGILTDFNGNSNTMREILNDINGNSNTMREILNDINGNSNTMRDTLNDIRDNSNTISSDMDRTIATLSTATASISALDNNVDEIREHVMNNSTTRE